MKDDKFKLTITTVSIVCALLLILIISTSSGKKLNNVKIGNNKSIIYSSRLLREIKNKNENIIISDLTLNPFLSLSYKYGSESVHDELSNYFEVKEEDLIKNYDLINKRYKSAYKIVDVSSSFWINNKEDISKEVAKTARNDLHFDILKKDFDKSKTVDEINKWIDNKSHKKIQGKISQSDIKNNHSILLNVLYFHDEWENGYKEEDIKEETFKGYKGEEKVSFLRSEENIYMETEHAKAFMKPYKSGIYFVGIIPQDGNSLSNIDLQKLLKSKSKQKVNVLIPEFEYKYEIDLIEPLNNLGIKSIFTTGNLDKIAPGVAVSKIYQKNYIKVDRNGTEAVSLNVTSLEKAMVEKKEVLLNQPFIFMIYDEKIDQVLFIGRVNYIKE